ncbi:hypothetical protein LTR28_008962 [Elasticomyces elasticus]|nr:hypothetical protein LTR28_008962 [Elasticomyces elasticus]
MAALLRSLDLIRSGRRGHLSVQLSAARTRIPRVSSDLLESGCHSNISSGSQSLQTPATVISVVRPTDRLEINPPSARTSASPHQRTTPTTSWAQQHSSTTLSIASPPPPQPTTQTMCKYYAHTHPCGHTKTVFAAYCPSGALVQRACGRGEIWQTLRLEASCLACGAETEKPALKVKKGAGKRGARR